MKIKLFTIPNIITLGNLLCGSLAILFVSTNIKVSFILILAAAVLDFLDGFTARMLKSYSEVGKQLDSLSDMVSFGLAPAMILYQMMLVSSTMTGTATDYTWISYIVFAVALFSALRLAKFNIDETQKEEFEGLPTPACAIFVASSGYLYLTGSFALTPWLILIVSLLLSYLLISPVRMFSLKFKNFSVKDNKVRYLFLLLALITIGLFVTQPLMALPLIIIEYIFISIFRNVLCSKR